MQAAAKIALEDRYRISPFVVEAQVVSGVAGDHRIDFTIEKRSDGTVGYWRRRIASPAGFERAFMRGMVFTIQHDDADIHVIMGDDLANFGRDSADDGMEIKLTGKQPGDRQVLPEQGGGTVVQHA